MQAPTISSRHAAMVVDAPTGSISVEDTGSTNGTFVNDEHIGFNGRRELRDGDRLRFGGYTEPMRFDQDVDLAFRLYRRETRFLRDHGLSRGAAPRASMSGHNGFSASASREYTA